MKPKKIKARLMWVYKDTLQPTTSPEVHGIWTYKSELHAETGDDFVPVFVLPADAASVERITSQACSPAGKAAKMFYANSHAKGDERKRREWAFELGFTAGATHTLASLNLIPPAK